MADSRVRKLVKQHIDNYYRAINLLDIHKDPTYMNACVQGSGEALLNRNPNWWVNRDRPVLEGDEIEQYAQAIMAINQILDLESEGMEDFEP